MTKRMFLVFLIPFVFSAFSYPEVRSSTMRKFDWIVGSWEAATRRGIITESWRMLNDSTFIGENKILRTNGETTVIEKLTFSYRNGEYFYTPTVIGQNDNKPIPFRITSYSESGFVAENPEHDFPKRIIYKLIHADTIHAMIDGGISDPGKKADFFYSRIKK